MIIHSSPRNAVQPDVPARRVSSRRAQSLVEFALSLPVLLLIVAGALEVGNVLTNYNRLQLTAREGARFGAAGGSDIGVREVVQQAAAESLQVDPDYLSIWIVRPVITYNGATNSWAWQNATGPQPYGVPVNCLYGDQCGVIDIPAPPARVLSDVAAINQADKAALNGKQMVVVAVYYEAPTILSLPFYRIPGEAAGRVPITAYAVLYQEIVQPNLLEVGCSSYALAIERTLLDGLREGEISPPVKVNQVADPTRRQGFGWLAWRLGQTEPNWLMAQGVAGASMGFPGTSRTDDYGFIEYDSNYGDPDPSVYDTGMHRGDWALASDANNTSNASTPLNQHMDAQRAIRVIVYDYEHDPITDTPINPRRISFNGGPEYWQYRIDGFVILRIHAWTPGGGSCQPAYCDTIEFEFVRWDESCGFDF